jgi:pyridinium-3,5-bisthiocarboxylic acid mononucleotide nickel chelatase
VRAIHFDCFSGISGDMALGALVDAGGDLATVEAAVEALGLAPEVRLSARHEQRGHLGGTRVLVEVTEGRARRVPDLLAAIERAELPAAVKERSLAAVRRLGEAESRVHGAPLDELHLHELGGADTLVDLVGTYWLLESLGVAAVYASPLPAPRGWLSRELPLPGPAVMRVLAGSGAVLEPDARNVELVTPTGAAILATAARFERPALRVDRVGYGIGAREAAGNALGVWLGEPVPEAATVSEVETHLDDMPPAQLAAALDALLGAGALDVAVTPIVMKKGRAGHRVTMLCEPSMTQALATMLLRQTSALGVRVRRTERIVAGRSFRTAPTPWGEVRVKVKELGGAAVDVAAEHDDCVRLGRECQVDPRAVARAAEASVRVQLGLE